MRYGSVCSGIEAATAAWHTLGWEPAFFSEIEAFPRAVLQHHYPAVPLHGDFTTIEGNEYGAIELLVGGTPCQAFSIAGLRQGFADERGNLTLEFIRLAQRLRPRWLVWENVPGVLSVHGGGAFGSFLGGLAECGYGFAYRVLDAQYFGVPQRRRRVFVIGYFGDWRPAAAVLFERGCLQGDITPSREAGQEVAGTFKSRANSGGWGQDVDLAAGGYMRPVANTLMAKHYKHDPELETFVSEILPINTQVATRHLALGERTGLGVGNPGDPMFTLQESHCHAVAIPIHDKATRCKGGGDSRNDDGSSNGLGIGEAGDPCPTLDTAGRHGVSYGTRVRRLTPRECERLQGFPDDFMLVPFRGKPASDGPRYKALGNSMAVPVMRWLGERIQYIESINQERKAA